MDYNKNTEELLAEIKKDKDIENYIKRNQEEFTVPLHEYLNNLLVEKNLSKKDVVSICGLERSYAYHIFSGSSNPSREKILALAIAMNLNLEETQYLLRYAKMSPLYPRDPWDSVIISAIEQHLNVIQTDLLLGQVGETRLLGHQS